MLVEKREALLTCDVYSVTCRDVVFRAVMGGQCVAAVKRTGRPERITAASVRDASAAWTTTVPGEKMSFVHVVCIHPLIGALYLSIFFSLNVI